MLTTEQINASFGRFLSSDTRPTAGKVTARLENVSSGVCPYCTKQMVTSRVNGQDVYYCADDRAVVPKPNSEL